MSVELTEKFLANIGGWEAMKRARTLAALGKVTGSSWQPPLLKGLVGDGGIVYRAGLVIKDSFDIENICSCRASRQRGIICEHSVAVGLHHLHGAPAEQPLRDGRREPARPAPKRVEPPVAGGNGRGLNWSEGTDAGKELRLGVILPPNLGVAARKGKVMVCLEGETEGGMRKPLDAWAKMGWAFRVKQSEAAILRFVEDLAEGETPGMMQLTREQFGQLLDLLPGFDEVSLGRGQRVEIRKEPAGAPIRATLQKDGSIELVLDQGELGAGAELIAAKGFWVLADHELRPVPIPEAMGGLAEGPIQLSRKEVPLFVSQVLPALAAQGMKANFRAEDFELGAAPPEFLLELRGGIAMLQARLQCRYGHRVLTPGLSDPNESFFMPDPAKPTRYTARDLEAERAALGRLRQYGFGRPDGQGELRLEGQSQVLRFFAREYPKLEKEWSVTLEERLERSAEKNLEWVKPAFEVTASGEQWFDLSVRYETSSGEEMSHAEIQRLLLSGGSHARGRSGKFVLIDSGAVEELQEVLRDCSPEQMGGQFRLDQSQAGFLHSAVSDHEDWTVQAPGWWREQTEAMRGRLSWPEMDLGGLKKVLRPYQKQGVGWISFLRQHRFGGILADEMGLGKTLQTLAFLQARKKEAEGPALVICPTSLVRNWANEAARFTPGLKVLLLHGTQREEKIAALREYDLVVTSYAVARRDVDKYEHVEFDVVVLDEAQHIKNRQTRNAQAVKALRARQRLVLTGTPLENSVLDLWSIFDFLMPGYLGSHRDFRERYEVPITRDGDKGTERRLAQRVQPFMLRRLKGEVAKDLPEKLEHVALFDLNPGQRSLYEQIHAAGRSEVLRAVDEQGMKKSRMIILNALLRMRQACCDPRLLKLSPSREEPSAKVELFEELLQEIIDGGHRVLVFSQFVQMLHLLRDRLDQEEISYCYLDGSTSNRGEVVDRFQSDSTIPVFLISLKAGGVGLNLTGADTVIHFDPWWNPAVEDQATDRAHRIGQSRAVTSYKLIARETVEEKILNLQRKKRAVLEGVMGGDEEALQALTWEDIRGLVD